MVLLYVPLAIGLIVGFVVFFLTSSFLKKKKSNTVVHTPVMITLSLSISLFVVGFFFVRGFEGASYLYLSVILLIITLITYFYAKTKLRTE